MIGIEYRSNSRHRSDSGPVHNDFMPVIDASREPLKPHSRLCGFFAFQPD
jgi:hypothetical protein